MDKIELAIQKIMAIVFVLPLELINKESSQDNINAWDSIKHLDLVVVLEEEFDILFPEEEIGNLISFKLIALVVKEQLLLEGKSY